MSSPRKCGDTEELAENLHCVLRAYLRDSAVNGHLHAPTDPLLGLRLFVFAAFALCLEALLAALGAVGGALHQLGAHESKHRLLGAIALAWSKTDDPGIAAVALPETRT